MNENRIGDWMQTYRGGQFWPLDPRPEEVFLEDIAHALAHICRFGAHCRRFYSVAEHSVIVSLVVPPEDALCALLHDAAEAYVADVPRPLKKSLTGYREIENRVWLAVAEKFGLAAELPVSVKAADNAVLLAEAAQVMAPAPAPWLIPGDPAAVSVNGHSPAVAKELFLNRFAELT